MSFKEFIGSALQVAVGVVLLATGNPSGIAFVISGLFNAAAVAFAPDMTEATDQRESANYGYGNFRNPVKGDSPVKIIFSNNGVKVAPVWVQAFVTPVGHQDDDYVKVLKAQGQGLSGLLVVGEGPVVEIKDIEINGEPVYTEVTDKEIGRGNGSRKDFEIPFPRVEPSSISVKAGTTPRGFYKTRKVELVGTGNGSRTVWKLNLPSFVDESANIRFFLQNVSTVAGDEQWQYEIDGTDDSVVYPHVWRSGPQQLIVNTQIPLPTGKKLYIAYTELSMPGIKVLTKGDGRVTLQFAVAPTSGTKIYVSCKRKNFPGLNIQTRLGGQHQFPLLGFDRVQNSYGVGTELIQNSWTEHDTRDEVDDIIIDVASGPGGILKSDDEGNRSATFAQFRMQVKRKVPATGGSEFNDWVTIYDPGKARSDNKSNGEFEVRGDSRSLLVWSYSIQGLLQRYAERNPNNKAAQRAARDFTRARYSVRMQRSSTVKSDTNDRYIDNIYWSSYREVIDEYINYPGSALLGFHALGSEKLQGSAPNITCYVIGKSNVKRWDTDRDMLVEDEEAQGNRVWACADLITSKQYGMGEVYDETNIDWLSAVETAAFQDEMVRKSSETTDEEKRSILDVALDSRRNLLEHLRDISITGRFWTVLQGDTFRFVPDAAVALKDDDGNDLVPVIYDDTDQRMTARSSLAFSHDSISTKATEVQVLFLDEEEDLERREVWVPKKATSTEPRRIRRATAFGANRLTEVTRYALYIAAQMEAQALRMVCATAPAGLNFNAGDVVRVISNRIGIDGYWRILSITWGTDNYFVRVEAVQYIPSVYGQDFDRQVILTSGRRLESNKEKRSALTAPTSDQRSSTQVSRRRNKRMVVRARRRA